MVLGSYILIERVVLCILAEAEAVGAHFDWPWLSLMHCIRVLSIETLIPQIVGKEFGLMLKTYLC